MIKIGTALEHQANVVDVEMELFNNQQERLVMTQMFSTTMVARLNAMLKQDTLVLFQEDLAHLFVEMD